MIIWTQGAEDDLDLAMGYLEGQQQGLGVDLVQEVEAVLDEADAFPRMYKEIKTGLRRVMTRRFGYGVFYRLSLQEDVVVVAIVHAALPPSSWP